MPMQEMIDIVDDQDNVVGCQTISESIRQGLNRRVAHIWIFDSERKLLVCQRPYTAHSYAGKWTSSAGGYVTAGESYEKTALRELEEELGITGSLKHAFLLNYSHAQGHHMFIDLWYGFLGAHVLTLDAQEIMATKWFSLLDLAIWMQSQPEDFNPEFIQLVDLWNKKYN